MYSVDVYKRQLNDMLETADFVSISVPLTPSTRDLITSENFKHFKKNAVLINTARGGIVNEEDLYEALKNKVIRAAAVSYTHLCSVWISSCLKQGKR